jgi:hypothetical protein
MPEKDRGETTRRWLRRVTVLLLIVSGLMLKSYVSVPGPDFPWLVRDCVTYSAWGALTLAIISFYLAARSKKDVMPSWVMLLLTTAMVFIMNHFWNDSRY